jgi:pilus assembly protein CpaF
MSEAGSASGRVIPATDYNKLKSYLIDQVAIEMEHNPPAAEQRNDFIKATLQQAYQNLNVHLEAGLRDKLLAETLDELVGYGPIQALLEDPTVTEVMVNGHKHIYAERKGKLERAALRFDSDAHLIRVIERIVLPLGRRIDHDHPTADARLPDGSRVNAVIPPVAIDGPTLTIRKFAKERLGIADLVEYGSITQDMADFLEACVKARLNIVISGGTGSGKTTLLNIMSSFIPESERIVTIEDAAELQLQQEHVVRLETKAADLDGRGAVDIRHLVKNSLRMRPDRIVVGEVRGGEALDMLQAMNTGHDGSLTTVHANTPRDSLSRMETLVLMAGMDLPIKVVREQIASAVDVIVQQSRLPDGSRKVTAITEVSGMEGDTIVMTDVFKFEKTGVSTEGKTLGELRPTGIRPLFIERLKAAGIQMENRIFIPNSSSGGAVNETGSPASRLRTR